MLAGTVGVGQGCTWGTPEPPCHRASTWQCSIHNAPGQDKRDIVFIAQPYDGELTVAAQFSGLKLGRVQQVAVFPHYLSMKT